MKYKVTNLRWAGTRWKCTLEYWKGCYCSAKQVEVDVFKEKRPTLKDIIESSKI